MATTPSGINDAIAKFLADETFRCTQLRVRMRPAICVKRQVKKEGRQEFGWNTGKLDTPADKFCRSGSCAQGQTVALGLRKRR